MINDVGLHGRYGLWAQSLKLRRNYVSKIGGQQIGGAATAHGRNLCCVRVAPLARELREFWGVTPGKLLILHCCT